MTTDEHIRALKDSTLERMRKHCIVLCDTEFPLNMLVGMKPFNMWVAISREQTRRHIENGGKLLRKADTE